MIRPDAKEDEYRAVRKIIWSIVIAIVVFFGFLGIRGCSQNKISFSYYSSEEFKNRITVVLTFIEKNYPEEYRLIRKNVNTIKEQKGGSSLNRAHMGGASYARTGEEWLDPDYGLIALMSVSQHCPPSLVNNKNQVINCAGVIYHEALHHYHANNDMYQESSSLEHYHVYRKHHEFYQKMRGERRTLQWLYQRMNEFRP